MAAVLLAFALAYAVQLLGWWSMHRSTSVMFLRQQALTEIVALMAAQAISISMAMWLSRIMRGWHLSNQGENEERPVRRVETITESTVVILLAVVAIVGPEWFLAHTPAEIGPLIVRTPVDPFGD